MQTATVQVIPKVGSPTAVWYWIIQFGGAIVNAGQANSQLQATKDAGTAFAAWTGSL